MSAPAAPIRVFVVDDHPALRDAIRDTLADTADLTVVGATASADDALHQMDALAPDVVMVDISLGTSHGLDLVKNLRARYEDVAVLVFSMYDEAVYAERSIQAGASGYVMKSEPISVLLAALRRVAAGDLFLSDDVTARLLQRMVGDTPHTHALDSLTDRELEVFQLLGEGYVLDDIKEQLHVSRSAVDKYRRQAMKKLGCSSVHDLLRVAIKWFHEQGSSPLKEVEA